MDKDAIKEILDLVAHRSAPGSAIAFDYLVEHSAAADNAKDLLVSLKKFVAKRGEPWISEMHPDRIESELLAGGFAAVHHIPPDKVTEEIAGGRGSFSAPPLFGLITATAGV